MADDKIIQFPTNRIVNDRSRELNAQRKKMGEKVAKEIQKQQTKQFVETAVDDISMNLLKSFVDLAMKTNNPNHSQPVITNSPPIPSVLPFQLKRLLQIRVVFRVPISHTLIEYLSYNILLLHHIGPFSIT